MLNRQALQEILASEMNLDVGAVAFPTTLTSVLEEEKVTEFENRYQLYNLNRKAEARHVSDEHRKAAWANFKKLQTELGEFNENFNPTKVLARARKIIRDLLPEFEFVKEDVWSQCTFGPGTFHGAVKHALGSSTHFKVGGDQTVTQRAKSLAIHVILNYFPNWADNLKSRRLMTVEGNRPSHVPKDVTKCRPISIEPSLNVFLQQGVGRWLGRYMKEAGFADIHDGQAVNRKLAADLSYGTIDLSNASDTISRELVEYLLPWDWFIVMDTIRSHRYEYRGERGTYQNFSSQGNAFTFPLETLIFKAVVMAYTGLGPKEVTVYGDDIIVPIQAAPKAVYGLHRSGFTVNTEKSYYGQHDDERKYFRESCGADYYRGTLVTPIYYRRDAEHDQDLAVLFNQFVEKYPSFTRAQEFILGACKKRALIGPRYIITDRPEESLKSVHYRIGFNTVSTMYDAYFWNEGILSGHPSSGRRWVNSGSEIRPKDYINERTAVLTFLLKGTNAYPTGTRNRVTVRKVDLTTWSPEPGVEFGSMGRLAYVNRPRFFRS